MALILVLPLYIFLPPKFIVFMFAVTNYIPQQDGGIQNIFDNHVCKKMQNGDDIRM